MAEQETEKEKRSEYRVTADDTLASLLERIREAPGVELLLDITDNLLLLKDGSLRRTLVSAANEFQKRVAFSFSEKENMRKSAREEKPKAAAEKTAKPRERGGESKPVPVSVFSQVHPARGAKKGVPKIKLGESGKRIAVFFSFFAGILLAGGIFFILPRAEVKITPEVEPISMDLALKASLSALNIDVENVIVPAQILNYEETASGAYMVNGFIQQGEKARGTVTIVNRTVDEQKIKGKSRLVSGDKQVFLMDEAIVVAPHSAATVKVTADLGGATGNLEKGKLFFAALPETDKEILYAEVAALFKGGTDNKVSALSKDDIENAKKQITAQKSAEMKKRLEESLAPGVVRDDRFFQTDLADLAAVESEGAQISEFHLKGKLHAKYFVFKQEDVFDLVRGAVGKRVKQGKILSKNLDLAGLTINKIDWQDNIVTFNYSVQNSVRDEFDLAAMKKNLVARTAESARAYLKDLSGVKDVSVTLRPFWVKRVPGFQRNIKIEITT